MYNRSNEPPHLWVYGVVDNINRSNKPLWKEWPSSGLRVAVAESLSRDLCGMKLNASVTKTMIVSRSHTMHPQSPALTIGGTVLKESDDLVILGVTFDSMMTFEKHLHFVSKQLLNGLVS